MGVGVYGNNYNGTGVSFLVDGVLSTEDDYRAYCQDVGDDDAVSFETWAQDAGDDQSTAIMDAIESVRVRVGLDHPGNGRARFEPDTDMSLLANGRFEIGLRSWEHDFVIGIVPDAALRENLEGAEDFNDEQAKRTYGNDGYRHRLFQWHLAAEDLVETFGLPANEVVDLVCTTVDNLKQLLILELQGNGQKCRFRTSGYTTGAYDVTADDVRETEMERLTTDIKAAMARLDAPAIDNLKALSAEQRHLLLKMTDRSRLSDYKSDLQKLHVLVPYATCSTHDGRTFHQINLYDLTEGQTFSSSTVPDSLKEQMVAFVGEGDIKALPDTPEWQAWWVDHRAKEGKYKSLNLIASAAEIENVWKDDIVLTFEDDEGDTVEVNLSETLAPTAPAPQISNDPSPDF